MRPALMFAALWLGASVYAQAPQTRIRNPTSQSYQLFFRPEAANEFITPPLTLQAGETKTVGFAAVGTYKTVLRSQVGNGQYVDSAIGWVDYRLASHEKPNWLCEFIPYSATEVRVETSNTIGYSVETRQGPDGSFYTVRVPHVVAMETHYPVTVSRVQVRFTSPSGESTDGARYIRAEPRLNFRPR